MKETKFKLSKNTIRINTKIKAFNQKKEKRITERNMNLTWNILRKEVKMNKRN